MIRTIINNYILICYIRVHNINMAFHFIHSPLGGVFGIYELLPAFLTSLLVCVVVSLVTPAPSKEIEAEFEAAK